MNEPKGRERLTRCYSVLSANSSLKTVGRADINFQRHSQFVTVAKSDKETSRFIAPTFPPATIQSPKTVETYS